MLDIRFSFYVDFCSARPNNPGFGLAATKHTDMDLVQKSKKPLRFSSPVLRSPKSFAALEM